MKIQIDTKAKTIKIEGDINLKELIKGLDVLFPGKEWEKYTLESNTVIYNWGDPIIINPQLYIPYTPNPYPWWTPVTCQSTYNVELVN